MSSTFTRRLLGIFLLSFKREKFSFFFVISFDRDRLIFPNSIKCGVKASCCDIMSGRSGSNSGSKFVGFRLRFEFLDSEKGWFFVVTLEGLR